VFGSRYRATEKIGTGGMADVYKAVDEVLGRTVAVKVMHSDLAADPSFAARFRQEAQAAANLVSPYIVNMYDWGQDGETYYMVMECVRGNDLKSIVEQKGPLPSRTVAAIGAQVCSALSVAHGYDIIHRDIKPHNIMVQPDGTVKVMDFGIARAGDSMMTQTGTVLGTAHYISPEQALGKPLGGTSDVYALGVVLFEAVTGRVPFDADTPVAVALMQVNEAAPRPSAMVPDMDPALDAAIMRAMQKQTAERYDSADEFRRDLRAIAQSRPAIGAGIGFAAAAAGTAALPRVSETSVLPAFGETGVAAGAPSQPDAPRSRRPVWPWIALAALLVIAGLGMTWGGGLLGGQGTDATARPNASVVETASAPVQPDVATPTVAAPDAMAVPVPKEMPVYVPDVVGMSADDAYDELAAAGFNPEEAPAQFDNDVDEGEVISQSPQGDGEAQAGATISYTVSLGEAPDETSKWNKSWKTKGRGNNDD